MNKFSAFAAVAVTLLFLVEPAAADTSRLAGDLGGGSDPVNVPAPSTLLLMAGAAGLLALKRKKK